MKVNSLKDIARRKRELLEREKVQKHELAESFAALGEHFQGLGKEKPAGSDSTGFDRQNVLSTIGQVGSLLSSSPANITALSSSLFNTDLLGSGLLRRIIPYLPLPKRGKRLLKFFAFLLPILLPALKKILGSKKN